MCRCYEHERTSLGLLCGPIAATDDDNAGFLRDVGADAARAVLAFARGDHGEVVRLLRPLRSHAHRSGGSHAQRDVIDLMLVEAARLAGDTALATALQHERAALRH